MTDTKMTADSMESFTVQTEDGTIRLWVDLFPTQPNGVRHGNVTALLTRKDASDVNGQIGRVTFRPNVAWFAARGGLLDSEGGTVKDQNGNVVYFEGADDAALALADLARVEVGA